jgi:hypothetical protein
MINRLTLIAVCGLLAGCAASSNKLVSFHDSERRESVILHLDGKGHVERRTVFAWRPQDKKFASSKTYDAKGVLIWREVYIYGEGGGYKEIQRFRPDGSLWVTTRFITEGGKHIRTEVLDADGKPIPPSEWKAYGADNG